MNVRDRLTYQMEKIIYSGSPHRSTMCESENGELFRRFICAIFGHDFIFQESTNPLTIDRNGIRCFEIRCIKCYQLHKIQISPIRSFDGIEEVLKITIK